MRIAEAREARGWSQERLAQAIGTTQQTVQRWESGQVDPQVSKIEAISKALGITVSFLLGVDSNGQETEASSLMPHERDLIALYRDMSPEYREMLYKSAVAYVEMTKKDRPGINSDSKRRAVDVVS